MLTTLKISRMMATTMTMAKVAVLATKMKMKMKMIAKLL